MSLIPARGIFMRSTKVSVTIKQIVDDRFCVITTTYFHFIFLDITSLTCLLKTELLLAMSNILVPLIRAVSIFE